VHWRGLVLGGRLRMRPGSLPTGAALLDRLHVPLLAHAGHRRLATGRIVLDEPRDPANPPRPRFDLANEAGGLVRSGTEA
jgi:hypothetical protein